MHFFLHTNQQKNLNLSQSNRKKTQAEAIKKLLLHLHEEYHLLQIGCIHQLCLPASAVIYG